MSKNLKNEYQNMSYPETPDLWNRISEGVDAGLYMEGSESFLPAEDDDRTDPDELLLLKEEAGGKASARKKGFRRVIPYISVAAAAVLIAAVVMPALHFGLFARYSSADNAAGTFETSMLTMDMSEAETAVDASEVQNGVAEMADEGVTDDPAMSTEEAAVIATESESNDLVVTAANAENMEISVIAEIMDAAEDEYGMLYTAEDADGITYRVRIYAYEDEQMQVLTTGCTYEMLLFFNDNGEYELLGDASELTEE